MSRVAIVYFKGNKGGILGYIYVDKSSFTGP
jgi:hypothetical protein